MLALLLSGSTVFGGVMYTQPSYTSAASLASTGAFVSEPMQYTSMASAASTGALSQPYSTYNSAAWNTQPYTQYTSMANAASTGALSQPYSTYTSAAWNTQPYTVAASWDTPTYTSMASAASTGALVQPAASWSPAYSYAPMASAASTGAYAPLASAASTATVAPAQPMIAPMASMTTPYMSKEIGSNSNPFNVNNLMGGKLIGQSTGKNYGVKQMMLGEEHVVHNDLQVLENHEADKTILTKKVVHHSPVLHKTIRTHEIAEDVVHDKLVHHMNTVKDQFKKVPGNNYVGGEQHVDHTTAIAPAPQIAAQPVKAAVDG